MRFRIVPSLLYLGLIMIVFRLWYWQILSSDTLTARAEQQRVSSQTLLAPRGQIYFSDGSLLASTEPTFLVFAQPKLIKNKGEVARKLALLFWEDRRHDELDVDPAKKEIQVTQQQARIEEDINSRLQKDLFWVSLGIKVSMDTKQRIEKENFFGIGFDTYLTRFYPEGSTSAHLLGFISSDAYGSEAGYFGLEGFYNGELKGKNGLLTQDKDAQGLPILIGTYKIKDAKPGKTLLLNVDRTIQHIVEENLRLGKEKYGAKSASAIVMDPKTGNVLALASFPNYDPAAPADFSKEFFRNPITVDSYEPGSTFKVLVMAAGINEDLVQPETSCDRCGGPLSIGGYIIRTWNNKYSANLSMTDAIIHSDNTGMVFVAKKLGADKLFAYIQKFGFGELTGIDLQDEQTPQLRPLPSWKEIDLATASFGQGISSTALQLVRAVAAIANNGVMMEPHVVHTIPDGEKDTVINPREVSRPISEQTAKLVTEMMVKAVEEGEAKFFKPKGFKVAGKTGTAQIPVAGHYDASKTIASFIGFAPADNPKFIMLVRYDQPSSSIYGAETAAPTFFNIAKEVFNYYGLA